MLIEKFQESVINIYRNQKNYIYRIMYGIVNIDIIRAQLAVPSNEESQWKVFAQIF